MYYSRIRICKITNTSHIKVSLDNINYDLSCFRYDDLICMVEKLLNGVFCIRVEVFVIQV